MTVIRPFKSFKFTNFGTNRKPVCDFLLLNILTSILSRTVSKLLQINDHIFAVDLVYLSFTHSLGLKLKFRTTKFSFGKLETFLYRRCKKVFEYLEPSGRESRVQHTDGQTARQLRAGLTQHRNLRANMLGIPKLGEMGVLGDRKSAISLQRGQFDPKFQVERVAPPHQSFLHG